MKKQFLTMVIIALTTSQMVLAATGKSKGGKTGSLQEKSNLDKIRENMRGRDQSAAGNVEQSAKGRAEMEQHLARKNQTIDLAQVEADFRAYAAKAAKGGSNAEGISNLLRGSDVTVEMVQESMKTEASNKSLPKEFTEAFARERGQSKSYEEAYVVALMEAKGLKSIDEALRLIKEACKI